MKKLLSIILALTLVLSLASCTGKITNLFSLGKVSNNVYENSYIGIGARFDSSWHFYTEDEIKQINNTAIEFAGEEYQELMENADVVYDMFAQTDDLLSSVNIAMEKVNPIQIATVDLKLSLEVSIPTVTSSYEKMGYKNVKAEVSTVEFAGETRDVLNLTGELNGSTFYLSTVNMKATSHVVNVTVGSFDKNVVDNTLKSFYALN